MAVIPLTATAVAIGGLPSSTLYTGSLTTTDTYTVAANKRTLLHFRKSGAGACTVTLITPLKVLHLTVADRTVTVPATTGDVMISGFDPGLYCDPLTGLMTFSLSEITGLTVGVFQVL